MAMPFYVSPEQMMQDKAEYARKGIARGKSIVAIEYQDGIALVAENPSRSLSKLSEIYDKIAFAGVGKYSEFENLRKVGIRYADVKGYSYSRHDVTAKSLANAYSQAIGQVFTQEMKPLEIEILIVEAGDEGHPNEMYHLLYDGTITDYRRFVVMGGAKESAMQLLEESYRDNLTLTQAVDLCQKALLKTNGNKELTADTIEVAILNRKRGGRKFQRLQAAELQAILEEAGSA
ncbi:MAG: proteasome subunit alpha [Deltaproteobacteria bacterium]|nr:proteasome subunit alpha [Deltaproteobacteria bacterium]